MLKFLKRKELKKMDKPNRILLGAVGTGRVSHPWDYLKKCECGGNPWMEGKNGGNFEEGEPYRIRCCKCEKHTKEGEIQEVQTEWNFMNSTIVETNHAYKHTVIVDEKGVAYCQRSNEYKELQKKIDNKEVSFVERDNSLNTLKETFFAYKMCGFSIEDLRTIVNEFDLFLSVAEERENEDAIHEEFICNN